MQQQPTGEASCPRCQHGLRKGAAGRVEALACDSCGGVWLDHALALQFNQALTDKCQVDVGESARIVGELVARKAKVPGFPTSPDGLPCVVCRQPLRREHIERAGFDLDICDAHGTFFDRGELQTIAHLVGAKPPAPLPEHSVSGSLKGGGDSAAGAVALGVLGVILEIITS
jgi:Zn-finger nucleic acid-binding protein